MAEPHPLAAVPPASKEASPPAETADGLFSRRRLHDAMRRYVQRCGSTGTANPRAALRLAARIAAITIVLMQFGAFIRRRSAPTRAALIILLASASAQLLSTQATLTASEATAPAAHEPIAAITMENEAVDHNVCGEAASDEAYDPGAAATPSRTSREAVLLDPDHLRGVFECLAPRNNGVEKRTREVTGSPDKSAAAGACAATIVTAAAARATEANILFVKIIHSRKLATGPSSFGLSC